eukprot:m.260952 g.260952  ORF g.260952 m.260952 type:complete len:715 (-) comp26656_c0_seq3:208-2352(-)
MQLGVLWIGLTALVVRATASCVIVRHSAASQDIKFEAYGTNAIRTRVVPTGSAFVDTPDIVSALVPFEPVTSASSSACPIFVAPPTATESPTTTPADLTVGNLRASVSADGLISFIRVSDKKTLVTESAVRSLVPAGPTVPVAGFLASSLEFAAVDGERFYGLGQHKTGILDYKEYGKEIDLAPHNTEITIPVAHSSLGYALLFNHPGFGSVQFNETVSRWTADACKQIDFWVATTEDGPVHTVSPWAQLQHAYADATGHAPVYPEWTSGFWQCKNRYKNQSQLVDVADGYISRGYPISLIIIDYYSWNPGPLGDETLPSECWPDPKTMVSTLKEKGVEVMISPYFHSVAAASKNYAEAAAKGYLAIDNSTGKAAIVYDNAALYDLFNPEARAYAFAAVEAGYIQKYGLHHWWLDCDEPCGGTNNGTYATDWLYNDGKWPAAFVGAAYPQMLDLAIWEGMGAPGKQYEHDNVMLGRAGWAGSQKYGGAVWSGDTESTWDDFNQQFKAGLNFVMSGIPYWTTDIGGFGNGNTTSPDFRELIVRWFQWGAFCPIFRLHGARQGPTWPVGKRAGILCSASPSNEVWMFGNESEAAIIKVMRIREQLRPYVMEQYRAASVNGTPIMRPLFYDFHTDAGSQGIDDQQMFGPDYLVAPVMVKGATSRSIYLPPLPKGTVWLNYFTGIATATFGGGKNITEATPLDTFPLYKRHTPFTYPK